MARHATEQRPRPCGPLAVASFASSRLLLVLSITVLSLPLAGCVPWWDRPWRYQWINVSVAGQQHPVLTRRVGEGGTKLFCVQGGPGGLFWDLNFLAVHLDLEQFEVIQYDPLGSIPSDCSLESKEPCAHDQSWMTVDAFVSTMDQVHRALAVPEDAIIIAHSFGVICTLEFLLKWPRRARGAVLSDWVASQEQSARRAAWCDSAEAQGVCRLYEQDKEEPWRHVGLTNRLLGHTVWGPRGDGYNSTLQGWDVRDRLASLQHIPTLSIVGEFDLVFASDVKEMSAALGGDYVFLPDAGHFAFTDQSSLWLQAFQAWMTRMPLPKLGSAGCSVAQGPAQNSNRSLDPFPQTLGSRRYVISLPKTYGQGRPHSVILSFHGIMDGPAEAPFYGPVPPTAGDVILVFPEGIADYKVDGQHARSWNGSGSVGSPGPAGPTCNHDRPHHNCAASCAAAGGCRDHCWCSTCADDVGFVSELLDELQSRYCVDAASVHAVGFSGGGWFVLELGTNPRVAYRFKSIVSLAGLPFRGFNRPPGLHRGSRFLGIYGRGDTTIPGFPNSPRDPTESLAETGFLFSTWSNTTELWAATLGCGGLTNSSRLRPDLEELECFDYSCPEGAVSVCFWDGPHAVAPGALSVAWQTFLPDSSPSIWSLEDAQYERSNVGVVLAGCAGLSLVFLYAVRQAKSRWTGNYLDRPLLSSPAQSQSV